MAAHLKKRALAEYCQTITHEESPKPAKRLQLVRRSKSSEHCDFNVSSLDRSIPPQELLPTLVSLQQILPLPNESRVVVLRRLLELLQGSGEPETLADATTLPPVITAKVILILANMASSATEIQNILERLIKVANGTYSCKVIAYVIQAASTLASNASAEIKIKDQVLQLALKHLTKTHYLIKVKCLETLGLLCGVAQESHQNTIINSILAHTCYHDNRVRTAAITALLQIQERGIKLAADVYQSICQGLNDEYQCVREASLDLIKAIAEKVPERQITLSETNDHHIRLADHAFSQICNAINDISVRVRTQAASLLGRINAVSDHFLQQTLDKKLMSNMRKKASAHERAKDMITSGEWSTGKRWAIDSPMEVLKMTDVQFINNGACGAFVHGLEDEFLEVRTATLDSIQILARKNPHFATQCLDFLVDMFHDEIEDVRLRAIQVLQHIAQHIQLRPDQLEEVLHALKDSWLDIREALHGLLATCNLTNTDCVMAAVDSLLDNMRRYPQDRRSIHRCLRQLGSNHPELILALVPQLLLIHPYFDGVEPSLQDQDYICKLILVLNAAAHCPTILPLLEQHTLRHYTYLRDTMPLLVPALKVDRDSTRRKEIVKTNTAKFLKEALQKLSGLEKGSSTQMYLTIYSTVYSDLIKLANIDPSLAPAAKMAALYTHCMMLFAKVFSTRNWLTPSSLSVQQSGALRTSVEQLLRNTLKLRYSFTNLTPQEEAAVRSLRVRTLALQLVYIVRGSTGSALGLCDNFLEHTEALQRYVAHQQLVVDPFLEAVVHELSQLDEPPKAGAVARIIEPLLLDHPIPALAPFANPGVVQMCRAEVLEPSADSEVVHKLSAGLVVGVTLDAELWHIPSLTALRIRVTYPDQLSHLIVPNRNDLRLTEQGCHRLLTTVLLSAQAWSEACQVGLSLVLDLSDQEALAGRRHSAAKMDDPSTTVQLCEPVKVLVWPKQVRKGLM